MKEIAGAVCIICLFVVFLSCGRKEESNTYARLVQSEVATGKRYDSIFFGIYLGMTAKDFFTHCWEMNKKGLFTDGRGNTAVEYKLNKNELKHQAVMHFYPELKDGKISKMLASIQYEGWAPWNKHLFADSLVTDLLSLYKKWYKGGNAFLEINDRTKCPYYVKVDGNRHISIRKKDDMEVEVVYSDMLKEPPVVAGAKASFSLNGRDE